MVSFVVKVFPRGTASFEGFIIGSPTLDCAPYGLELRIRCSSYRFDGLGGVHLPRYDLPRRNAPRIIHAIEDPQGPRALAAKYTLGGTNSCRFRWKAEIATSVREAWMGVRRVYRLVSLWPTKITIHLWLES